MEAQVMASVSVRGIGLIILPEGVETSWPYIDTINPEFLEERRISVTVRVGHVYGPHRVDWAPTRLELVAVVDRQTNEPLGVYFAGAPKVWITPGNRYFDRLVANALIDNDDREDQFAELTGTPMPWHIKGRRR
jgi:hypothetical protein